MLIRCKLIRPSGTTVTLGKGKDRRDYHFKPADDAKPGEDHVCEVNDADDIATLLAIREGYEVHASELKAKATAKPAGKPQAAKAPEALTDPAGDETPPAARSKAELLAAVAEKTGKKPHPSTSTAKLQALLDAK